MDKKHPLKSNQLPANIGIAACTFALGAAGDGSMQLFPAGTFDAPRGALRGKGPWRLDADSAKRLIGVVSQRTNDIVVDYEHQSMLTAQNGKPVVAAGWIGPQTLEWREPPAAHPGLFAISPKWTAAASAHIAADEIRYVSPVFSYDAKTGEVLDILNVALTNNPAIDGMQAVTVAATSLFASVSTNLQEPAMDPDELIERLIYMLNLPVTSTPAEIAAELDKVKALITASDGTTAGLSVLLASKADEIAALSAQIETQTSATPDLTQFVPIAVFTETQKQLAALSGNVADDRVEKLIEQGKADGRIIGEELGKYLTNLGKQNFAALSGYLDSAQPIAALSGMQTHVKAPEEIAGSNSLTADELVVCSGLGVDPLDYQKTKEAR
ncbi:MULTISPECIES: phage protease [Methylobacter]